MCLHTFTSPARLLESANETLREAGDQSALRLVPSLAMNINFFCIQRPSLPPPDTPPDTKENQLSVCVSDYREVAHGSFTQSPLPHMCHTCVEAVQKQKNEEGGLFFFLSVACIATVNIRLNKDT